MPILQDDQALVGKLRARDKAAFATLVRELHGSLVRVAMMFVKSRATAEDVAQDTWGKVLAYEAPSRLLLGMQFNTQFQPDPSAETEVEITFAQAPGGGCVVTLRHGDLERLGEGAEPMIEAMRDGWSRHVQEFAQCAGVAG